MPQNTPRGYTYPLYTDPANFPAQIQDFATDVDTDVAGQVTLMQGALSEPSVQVSASANQSIPVSTQTFVTFATEDYDNAGMAQLGINNDRIEVTVPGIYLVTAFVSFSSNGNATVGGREMTLYSLGADVAWDNKAGSQAQSTQLTITYLMSAVLGQLIQVRVDHNSGAAVNISNRGLSATRVSP